MSTEEQEIGAVGATPNQTFVNTGQLQNVQFNPATTLGTMKAQLTAALNLYNSGTATMPGSKAWFQAQNPGAPVLDYIDQQFTALITGLSGETATALSGVNALSLANTGNMSSLQACTTALQALYDAAGYHNYNTPFGVVAGAIGSAFGQINANAHATATATTGATKGAVTTTQTTTTTAPATTGLSISTILAGIAALALVGGGIWWWYSASQKKKALTGGMKPVGAGEGMPKKYPTAAAPRPLGAPTGVRPMMPRSNPRAALPPAMARATGLRRSRGRK